ncbi:hypothetical protein Mlaev_00188 [Microbacterium laevaniformans]|uniref:Uncharacterized protein n=1 Tax=Microbacterium laevaniformans TaxID=36807 RepID=A0A150HHZ9_9MICO|nr:hypothetical protein Mlaev_00188 [Microbacterium laevaniformans]
MPRPYRLPRPEHLRQIPPRDPAPIPVDDRLDHQSRVRELPSGPARRTGQQIFDQRPLSIREHLKPRHQTRLSARRLNLCQTRPSVGDVSRDATRVRSSAQVGQDAHGRRTTRVGDRVDRQLRCWPGGHVGGEGRVRDRVRPPRHQGIEGRREIGLSRRRARGTRNTGAQDVGDTAIERAPGRSAHPHRRPGFRETCPGRCNQRAQSAHRDRAGRPPRGPPRTYVRSARRQMHATASGHSDGP